jgi:hypothetical protein
MCLKVPSTYSGSFPSSTYWLKVYLRLRHLKVSISNNLIRYVSYLVTETPRNVIYLLHVKPSDYLRDIRGVPYSRETYYSHPEMFTSHFHEKVRRSSLQQVDHLTLPN